MKTKNFSKKLRAGAGLAAVIAGGSVMAVSTLAAAPVMAETTAVNAGITQDKAKSIVLAHAKASANQVTRYHVEIDRERYGTFYEIDFNFNGYEYEYKINSSTGAIVEWDKEPIKGYNKPAATTPAKKNTATAAATSYIGEAKAKNIALTHAKANANQITEYKISLDNERGVAYYDVDFHFGDYDFDYDINAKTGAIIKYEKELDIDRRYEGYVLNKDGKWYYAKNGRIDRSYTGLAYNKNNGGWFYANKGLYDPSYTGIAKSTNGLFYFVNRGRWDTSYTGLAPNTNGQWYYVKNGRYVANYTGIAKSTNGKLYYAKNGKWDTSYTGLAPYTDGQWYYVRNGRHVANYTGITPSTNGKLYYAKNGKWDTSFSGKVNYMGKTYIVRNGRV